MSMNLLPYKIAILAVALACATACSSGSGADCIAGSRACSADDPLLELICVVDETDTARWEQGVCPTGSECVDDRGCASCIDTCTPGTVACAPDPTSIVMSCLPVGPTGCNRFVGVFDCRANGLSTCIAPAGEPEELAGYCVNECGGRFPLDHAVCSPHDEIACAVWVCDAETQEIVPDHTACKGGGAPCAQDSDCVSCRCGENGVCVGSNAASCEPACNN